jgi:putative DNA primase/helicase
MADDVAVSQAPGNIAIDWYDGGCSVVPIRTDGSKRPAVEWGPLQSERMTREQVASWWRARANLPTPGVAVICGKVSGNLEMVEIEGGWTSAEDLSLVSDHCEALGVREIWEDLLHRGYAEWSPSGGIHVLYRLSDGEVPGNTKLASTPEGKTKAETRGEGGYCIVAPTTGACHPSGEPWTTVAGMPGLIPYLTLVQRDAIHQAIRNALDESPPAPPPPPVRREQLLPATLDRPGDAYNAKADWDEILSPHGWQVSERRGQETLWVRPDKNRRDGHSASTGYADDADRMYVWSTSAGLPTETPLSKFFVYTALNHGGDFKEATRTLSRLGFGTPRQQAEKLDWATEPAKSAQVALRDATMDVDELPSEGEVPRKDVNLMFTDSGNANRMQIALGGKCRYIPARNKWLMFRNGAWVVDHGMVALRRVIADMVYEFYKEAVAAGDEKAQKHWFNCQSEARITAMAKMMKGHPEIYSEPEDFDAQPHILNLANKTINLETLEVHDHQPEDLLTKKMLCGYDPDAIAPRWDQYLKEVLPDPDMRDFLQRLAGYSLTGEPVERALVILHGPGGTGKSRFIETLSTLFGSYGTTAADSLFRSKRDQPSGATNDLNDLKGARMASVSELDAGIRMDEALVKRLTGFDTITSRGLYEENTTWRPQCVIWLATNHHFRISSDDGAIWKRLKVIPFTQEISAEVEDPHILKKLLAEKDGIFNWMLEGLAKYREHGLRQPEGAQEALAKYRSEQDLVGQFVEDMVTEGWLTEGECEFAPKAQVLAGYQAWCKDQGEFALSKTRFNYRMEALGYEGMKRSGRMCWKGLRVNVDRGMLGTL